MTYGFDLATFIIEPEGTDKTNPASYIVRKKYNDAITVSNYSANAFSNLLQDINTDFCSSSTSIGCRILLKNGTYKIDQGPATDGGLVVFGTTDEGGHVNVYMEGETRDNTIIRNIETAPEETPTSQIIRAKCSLTVNNLTIDGNNLTASSGVNGIKGYGQLNGSPILEAHNCRFMKMYGTNFSTGSNWSTFIMENCILEKPAVSGDQSNFEIASNREGYAIIRDNFFDRSNGSYSGQGASLTSGGSHNVLITGNIIKRDESTPGVANKAISLETFWDQPFEQCTISNNLINNGEINIGQSSLAPDPDQVAKNIYITGNTIYQGGIHVEGPATGDVGNNYIYNIIIDNNTITDAWETGIYAKNIGLTTIRNNTIINSNKSLTTFGGQETLIYLNNCVDMFCENNFCYMGTLSGDADFSPQGIRYRDMVNSTIRNNRIVNRTIANNSYQDNAGNTGCTISKSL